MLAEWCTSVPKIWGPLFWWRTRGKLVSLMFHQEMMDSRCSKSSQRVSSLILEPDGGSEIFNLSFLLNHLWPDHVMVFQLSALVKESCKYLFSPSLLLWCDFYSPVFPKPFSGVFFLSITDRREGINKKTPTEQGVSCRATGAVSMTWDSSKPENQIKVKMLGNTNVQSVFWQPHPTPASSSSANTINTEQETHPTQTSGVGNSNPLPGMGFNRREKFK